MKEEALAKIQVFFQETNEENPSCTIIVEASTMIDTNLVSSPSFDFLQDNFGEFENHSRGIGSKLLRLMGYDGEGIGKTRKGILNPIVDAPRVNHKGLCFNGKWEKHMTMKTCFVKEKDMKKLAYSSEEREVVHEVGIPLPLQPSCCGLKKRIHESISKSQPTPTLRRIGKPINSATRRRRPKGIHQTRHHLFVTVAIGNAITSPGFGTYRYDHFVGRKNINRHLVGRINSCATSQIYSRERMVRRLP
jgi:hypothetical protein